MRATLAFAALLLVGLTGCDPSTVPPSSAASPAAPIGGALGAPVAPSPAPAPAPAPELPEGNPAPVYPATARAYTEAAIAAWVGGNIATLGGLTTAMVQEQLVEIPELNDAWVYQNCDGTAGSHYCAFRNANGDLITLKVVNQYLGQAHAINQVTADLTTYPADGEQYVRRFLAAWAAGNTPRMQALATASVVTSVSHHKQPAVGALVALTSKSGGAGLMIVTVQLGGKAVFRLHVGTTLLGQKHAIVGYEAIPLSLTT